MKVREKERQRSERKERQVKEEERGKIKRARGLGKERKLEGKRN